MLFVDVDDFKEVNDEFGHEVGDRFLVHVAQMLTRALRAGDMVGRWGGDEFVVLPYRLESTDEALFLAERIHIICAEGFDVPEGVQLQPKLSVGIGWTTDSTSGTKALIRAADEALYEAKALGKGISQLRKV